jgi:hypothetical protein
MNNLFPGLLSFHIVLDIAFVSDTKTTTLVPKGFESLYHAHTAFGDVPVLRTSDTRTLRVFK